MMTFFLIKVHVKAAKTKSDILSSLTLMYDTLGLIAPLRVQGKLLLHEVVTLRIPRSLIKPNLLRHALNYTVFNDAS